MRKLIGWIWGLVPEPARIYVVIATIIAAIGSLGFMVYKIDANGYDRCELEHKAAVAESKDKARPPIIDTGKAHDKIKAEVAKDPGNNDPAGARVSHALDSLRDQMGDR